MEFLLASVAWWKTTIVQVLGFAVLFGILLKWVFPFVGSILSVRRKGFQDTFERLDREEKESADRFAEVNADLERKETEGERRIMKALEEGDITRIVNHALADEERGLGGRGFEISREALDLLTRLAVGDARRALTLLDAAGEGAQGRIERAHVEAAVEVRLPDYDKDGDQHYDVISAFIKSMRGSDPDAAMYWLLRMLEAGEDPRYITRRMIIFASEDIGNADSNALTVANGAAEAFDRVGLPEGRLILSQAVTYLATAPKSNSALNALAGASEAVREFGALPVPMHLRNAPTPLMKREGHGQGYQYPHDHDDHFVAARYLPDRLASARFYEPSDQGEEAGIGARLRKWWGDAKTVVVKKVNKGNDGG